MITENLSTLKIHKLTQEQYDRELKAGRVDPSALYLTPDDGENKIYIQDEEPVDAEVGTLWVDTDEEGFISGAGSGESSIFEVTVNADTMTASHSATEIEEASNSGKIIIMFVVSSDGSKLGQYSYQSIANNGGKVAVFSNVTILSAEYASLGSVIIDENKAVTLNGMAGMLVPSPSDVGTILSVTADGLEWATIDSLLPSAEGGSY